MDRPGENKFLTSDQMIGLLSEIGGVFIHGLRWSDGTHSWNASLEIKQEGRNNVKFETGSTGTYQESIAKLFNLVQKALEED